MARAFVGVGSNLDPEANVPAALRLLARKVRVAAISIFYATEPLGRPEQPVFYNGVIEIETDIPARELKRGVLRPIEAALGRQRTADRYAARTIDLDLLIYGELVAEEEDLALPDPEIAGRAFLAVPLAELAPEVALPGDGRPLREIAAGLGPHDMKPLPDFTRRIREEIA